MRNCQPGPESPFPTNRLAEDSLGHGDKVGVTTGFLISRSSLYGWALNLFAQ